MKLSHFFKPFSGLIKPSTRYVWVTLGLLICFSLLFYANWLHRVRRANNNFQSGQYEVALADYRVAQQRIPKAIAALPGFRFPLRETLLKQVQILYLQRNFDRGLEFLQGLTDQYAFLEADPQYHQWYANVLFQHTLLQEEPDALLDGFYATLREYQKALELDPSNWDARYNYEFVKRILTDEERDGQQKLELLIKEMREERRRDEQQLPPDKRG